MHSFTDKNGKRWTACSECNRGGNGNDKDKCACGWNRTYFDSHGCYIGIPIVGIPKKQTTKVKAKQRYKRYLEYKDSFDSFIDFCYWDAKPERRWNKSVI